MPFHTIRCPRAVNHLSGFDFKSDLSENENFEKDTLEIPGRGRDRRPALVFLSGELLAVQIPLERDEVILGRALEADVRVNDARASRLHARITTERDPETGFARYRITDLGSTNGTVVNGQLITNAILQDGDKIVIGEHLLRFDMLDERARALLNYARKDDIIVFTPTR